MSSNPVKDSVPAYRRVADTVRAEISRGCYRDGVRLPTEFELAERFSVSRQTVRRAFSDLVAEGVVYRVPGRGTFTTESGRDAHYLRHHGTIEDLLNLSYDTSMEIIRPLRRRVDIEAAARLQSDSDIVHTVVFRRLHDGIPFVHTTVHLPTQVARHIAHAPEVAIGAIGTSTIIGLLAPHLPSPIAEAAQSITVATAGEDVAEALGCEVGHPMLRIDRVYSDGNGRIDEVSISHFLPEHYTYRVTLRRG